MLTTFSYLLKIKVKDILLLFQLKEHFHAFNKTKKNLEIIGKIIGSPSTTTSILFIC